MSNLKFIICSALTVLTVIVFGIIFTHQIEPDKKAQIVVNKLGEYAVKANGQYLHLYIHSGGYIQGVGYGYDSTYQFAYDDKNAVFFKTEVEAAIALTRYKQYVEDLRAMNEELAADKRKEDSIRALRFDVKPVN